MSTEEAVERETLLRAGGSRIEYLRLNVRQEDSGTLGWDPNVLFLVFCFHYNLLYNWHECLNSILFIRGGERNSGVGVMDSQN